jgi:hypothetical protein
MNKDIISERERQGPKWLIMKVSYPGVVAAFFRTKNPVLVIGARQPTFNPESIG